MKKQIVLWGIVALLSSTAMQAKDNGNDKKPEKMVTTELKELPAQLKNKGGKTENVKIQLTVGAMDGQLDMDKLQKEITYTNAKGEKKTASGEDVSMVTFTYDSVEYRMLSCPNKLKLDAGSSTPKYIFLKLEVDGTRLRLLRYYQVSTSKINGNELKSVSRKYVLRKSNDTYLMPEIKDFKKDMTEFFSDCQGLVFKLSKNQLVKKDMVQITNFYNSECK
ncbi:MAG: hypothetical protein P4L28_00400 [Paludibacteraceae bacterium]|nr:hypothetical protein [Paludibacteraceae bacterium]